METATQKLDKLLETESNKKNTHDILLAVQNIDKTLDYRAKAGRKDLTTQDPFFVASQTKMMTATIIFQLVDEGRLTLEDKMATYVEKRLIDKIHIFKGVDYSENITIRNLLHQTSGLPDFFLEKNKGGGRSLSDFVCSGEDDAFTRQDYLEMAKQMTPKFEPSAQSNTKSFYSDTNFQLLGAVIEAVTKKSISENFADRIFKPLGLSDNTYAYDYKTADGKSIQPLTMRNKSKEIHIPKIMTSFEPDGGVVSTMDDMLVFLRAYFDGELFHKDHLEDIQSQWNPIFNAPIQYGLGLMRFKLPGWMTLYCFSFPTIYGHSGSNASFSFYAPDKQAFIVGTFNQVDQESRPFNFMLKVLQCLD